MVTYKDYENLFNHLGISETEANAVIEYMYALAGIGISEFNIKFFENDEKLRDLDESVNQASRG